MHVVTISINSPTFDLITKDAKTTFMDRLAIIGGTLGLFTGFSVISGIEVSKEANSQHQNQTSKLVRPIISPDPLLLGQTRDRSA